MSNVRSSLTLSVLMSLWSVVALTRAPPTEPAVREPKDPLESIQGRIDQFVDLNPQTSSVAPCASPTWPVAPGVGSPPIVATWQSQQAPSNWEPPHCAGWEAEGFGSYAAVAGTFEDADLDAIVRRVGAISSYGGMHYWSVSDGRLEVLITDAFAVDGANPSAKRADFTPAEMQVGREFYFVERDNRSSAPTLYRMKIIERDAGRLIIDFVNVSTVSKLFVTIFRPGDLRTTLFVSARGEEIWHCYALSAANPRAFAGLLASEKSLANRLLAFYAHSARLEDSVLPWRQ